MMKNGFLLILALKAHNVVNYAKNPLCMMTLNFQNKVRLRVKIRNRYNQAPHLT